MVRFTSSKETGTVRCTKCGGLVSGELQYTGDNYCKGHEQLNIARVSNLVCGWINDGYRPPCYMNKEMKCEDCTHAKQTCC